MQMISNRDELRECKALYLSGWTKQQMWNAGFSGKVVAEAIRQANQSFRLPSFDTPKKRCPQCGHKCYATVFVNGICQGCHMREVVNQQWKGRFRV